MSQLKKSKAKWEVAFLSACSLVISGRFHAKIGIDSTFRQVRTLTLSMMREMDTLIH